MPATLREQVIRLAHLNPELREHLLPLIRSAAEGNFRDDRDDLIVALTDAEDAADKAEKLAQKLKDRADDQDAMDVARAFTKVQEKLSKLSVEFRTLISLTRSTHLED